MTMTTTDLHPAVIQHYQLAYSINFDLPDLIRKRYQTYSQPQDQRGKDRAITELIRALSLQQALEGFLDKPNDRLPNRLSNAVNDPDFGNRVLHLMELTADLVGRPDARTVGIAWFHAAVTYPGDQQVSLQQVMKDWHQAFLNIKQDPPWPGWAKREYMANITHNDLPPRTDVRVASKYLKGWADCVYDPEQGMKAAMEMLARRYAGDQITHAGLYPGR